MSNITKQSNSGFLKPFFSDFFDSDEFFQKWPSKTIPAVNISESKDAYTVELAVPGYKKEEFKVKVDKNMLSISADTRTSSSEEKKEYTRKEYHYSSFSRSFRLPDNVKDDAITAKYENGILQLQLPKSQTEVNATKDISVS